MSGEILYNLPREEYDRINRVHWSTLKLIGQSPALYRYAITNGTPETPAKKLGRATHLAGVEPERFRTECVLWDGGTRRGKDWEAFKKKHAGREILTENEHAEALALSSAARADKYAAPFLSGGKSEVTVLWTHVSPAIGGLPALKVECKARLDFVVDSPPALADLKTTRSASPSGFGRESINFGYHIQAAFYRDGYFAATGQWLPYFLIPVEKPEPHIVQVYEVKEDKLLLGREEYTTLLSRLDMCRSENSWPGYFTGVGELEFPRWAAASNDDEDVTGLGLVIGREE